MPLTDWELWACAQHIIARFGEKAQDHAFDRIVDLARQGDEAGVATWQAIGLRIESLTATPTPGETKH